MWIQDQDQPSQSPIYPVAFERAMSVNGCPGTNLDDATLEDYPIGGGNPDDTCKKVVGCPQQYPLIFCMLTANQHGGGHEGVVNPGFATYFASFFAEP
jgi:hypothetical protein